MSTAPIPSRYSSREDRRKIYEALAAEFVGEYVKVTFVANLRSHCGTKCDGIARWAGKQTPEGKFYYEILLDDALTLEREGLAAAHELAHVKAGDPAQIAPTYFARIVQHRAARGRKTVTDKGDPDEDRAAALGATLHRYWRTAQKIRW